MPKSASLSTTQGKTHASKANERKVAENKNGKLLKQENANRGSAIKEKRPIERANLFEKSATKQRRKNEIEDAAMAGKPSAEEESHGGECSFGKVARLSIEQAKRKASCQTPEVERAVNKIPKCATVCTLGGVDQHKGMSAGRANSNTHND